MPDRGRRGAGDGLYQRKFRTMLDTRDGRRHEVRPGATGWAQVKGRNALTWEEKLELDVWYVEP